jgi:hypothetical protein
MAPRTIVVGGLGVIGFVKGVVAIRAIIVHRRFGLMGFVKGILTIGTIAGTIIGDHGFAEIRAGRIVKGIVTKLHRIAGDIATAAVAAEIVTNGLRTAGSVAGNNWTGRRGG